MEPPKQKSRTKIIIAFSSIAFLSTLLFFSFNTGRIEASSISKKFNYQGRLGDAAGTDKADGAYDMVFKIYSTAGGGSALWTETWTSAALWTETAATTIEAGTGGNGCTTDDIKITYTTAANESSLKAGQTLWNTTLKNNAVIDSVDASSNVICVFTPAVTWIGGSEGVANDLTNRVYLKNGIFSITLGTVSDQTLDFSGGDYYLGVKVGTDDEMIPRKPLTSVPQAMNANNLKGDGSIDLDNILTTGDAANINYSPASGANNALVVTYGGSGTGTALKVTQSSTGYAATFDGGNVGIGTTTPTQIFQVNSSATSAFVVTSAGQVGIGTTAPTGKLNVVSTGEQLRLGYDTSNYWSSTVGATGGLTLAGTGAGANFKIVLNSSSVSDNYNDQSKIASIGNNTLSSGKLQLTEAVCGAYSVISDVDGLTYGTVVGEDDNCWLDRNLGAATAAVDGYNDESSYGYLYQWGRLNDHHQYTVWAGGALSSTTTTQSSGDVPGHANFIYSYSNWRATQNDNLWGDASRTNNPCPTGWHVPTGGASGEWKAWTDAAGLTNCTTNCREAFANSALKLPAAGFRYYSSASLGGQGSYGRYWSSSPDSSVAYDLSFVSGAVYPADYYDRAYGFSVRCVKDSP